MKGIAGLFVGLALTLSFLPVPLLSQPQDKIEISRMVLCEGINGREPVNPSEDFSPDINRIYCFTEIRNIGAPTTVTHRWFYNDKLVAEVPLNVEGSRFRTWSSKRIPPQDGGIWKVEVVGESGQALGEIDFRVSAVDAATGN